MPAVSLRPKHDDSAWRRASNAARRRRTRERERLGLKSIRIDVAFVDLSEALVDANRLHAWDATDRKAVGEAIRDLLTAWLGKVTRDGVDPLACEMVSELETEIDAEHGEPPDD
jgi:hypothetical protein